MKFKAAVIAIKSICITINNLFRRISTNTNWKENFTTTPSSKNSSGKEDTNYKTDCSNGYIIITNTNQENLIEEMRLMHRCG